MGNFHKHKMFAILVVELMTPQIIICEVVIFDELTTATVHVSIPNSMVYVTPSNATLYLTCLHVATTPTDTMHNKLHMWIVIYSSN